MWMEPFGADCLVALAPLQQSITVADARMLLQRIPRITIF